jgi:hypothetical protein
VFERARIQHKPYRYWDAAKRGLNIEVCALCRVVAPVAAC